MKVFQLEPESKSLLALIWQALQEDTQTSITDLPELTQLMAAGHSLHKMLAAHSGRKVMVDQLRAAFMVQQKVRRPLLQLAVWSFNSGDKCTGLVGYSRQNHMSLQVGMPHSVWIAIWCFVHARVHMLTVNCVDWHTQQKICNSRFAYALN